MIAMHNRMMKCSWIFLLVALLSGTVAVGQTNFWEPAGPVLPGPISSLACSPNGDVFVKTYDPDWHVYRSTDAGNTWSVADAGSGISIVVTMTVSLSEGTLVIAGWDSVGRSTDGGLSWSSGPTSIRFMNMTSSPDGILFGGTPINGAVRSTDDGVSWRGVSSGLTQYSIYSFGFVDVAHVFCSSYGGAVYQSSDTGSSWVPIPIPNAMSVDVLSLLGLNATSVIAGTSGGIYRTLNGGTLWEFKSDGLANLSARALCMNAREQIFAATGGGVFRSADLGNGWQGVNDGLSDLNVNCLALAPDGRLFAGTASGQVYRSVASTNGVTAGQGGGIQTYELEQNYPNPFNPTTLIRYSIPVETYNCTSLRVYDLLGREVAVLVNERKAPGTYSVEFIASSLATGIYFYRLTAGSFVETRKMAVVR